ncbi:MULTISPECIES: YggT family protein [unclassified Treponema]|uniref:YggT family protein n=1 Tax=unclassified Treponema TaxID=2638727 RepID=UPI0020A5089F|nr:MULTISPECIES: YggT family protein [unclassified Treponema]UTC67100.1 YggT family protein [Treponema sp. OMZ 789]UTC69831.1 YggT family protein [Treponema sp. OMZ 790]UTC72545.1 YggT family protein [Treponema sp. OMZ 791]
MISSLFNTLGFAVKLYSYLCIIYIFLSWIGSRSRGGFLYEICNPYLGWFRRFKFTQVGMVDFSPILAIGVLSLFSNILFQIADTRTFSVLGIVLNLIAIIWSFFSFLLNFFIIILIIRLVLDFSENYRRGNFADMLDRFLSPVFVRVHKLSGGKFMSLRKQIIVCLIVLILMRFLLGALIGSLGVMFKYFRLV